METVLSDPPNHHKHQQEWENMAIVWAGQHNCRLGSNGDKPTTIIISSHYGWLWPSGTNHLIRFLGISLGKVQPNNVMLLLTLSGILIIGLSLNSTSIVMRLTLIEYIILNIRDEINLMNECQLINLIRLLINKLLWISLETFWGFVKLTQFNIHTPHGHWSLILR